MRIVPSGRARCDLDRERDIQCAQERDQHLRCRRSSRLDPVHRAKEHVGCVVIDVEEREIRIGRDIVRRSQPLQIAAIEADDQIELALRRLDDPVPVGQMAILLWHRVSAGQDHVGLARVERKAQS